MKVEQLSYETHYRTVCHWWESHSWPIIPRASLTNNGIFVSDSSGRGVCAGWLFSTDSNVAWIEYIVKNPEASREDADTGLNLLIHGLIAKAKELGFAVIFTTVKSLALSQRYAKLGFLRGDEGMNQFIYHTQGAN